MADIETRELRFFTAVAQERNFTKAAEKLGMAQPPLSRAIRQLERRLGVTLFDRDHRQVTLTPAGEALWEEARTVLSAMESAVQRTRRTVSEDTALVLTAKPGIATSILNDIVDAFGKVPDGPGARKVISGFGEQLPMLRDGRADLAIIGSPLPTDQVDVAVLTSESRVAALPVDHPLTAYDELSCDQLRGQPFSQWPNATLAERYYWAGRADEHDGPTPTGPEVGDSSQMFEAIALSEAVGIVPASLASNSQRPDICVRPVRDASPYEIAVAWPRGSRDKWVARFVRTAVTVTAVE